MPIVRMQPRNNEMVLIREVRDSAGRTDEQVKAMRLNDPKPHEVEGVNLLYAQQIATEHRLFPKVMYKTSVKTLTERPDEINPKYPMPYDLAIEAGYQGQVQGQGSNKAINVTYPYRTCYVPLGWDPQFPTSIDEKECRKEQSELEKNGWVDHPSKLKPSEKAASAG